jgi:hypothetical protein
MNEQRQPLGAFHRDADVRKINGAAGFEALLPGFGFPDKLYGVIGFPAEFGSKIDSHVVFPFRLIPMVLMPKVCCFWFTANVLVRWCALQAEVVNRPGTKVGP